MCAGFLYLHYQLESTTRQVEAELQKENSRSTVLNKQLDSLEFAYNHTTVPREVVVAKPTTNPATPVVRSPEKSPMPPPAVPGDDKVISKPPVEPPPKEENTNCTYSFNGTLQIDKGSVVDQASFNVQSLNVNREVKEIRSVIILSEYTDGERRSISFNLVSSKSNEGGDFRCAFREIPASGLNEFEKMNPRLLSLIITGTFAKERVDAVVTWNQVSGRTMTAKMVFVLVKCG